MIAGFGEVIQHSLVRTMVSAHDTVDAHLKLAAVFLWWLQPLPDPTGTLLRTCRLLSSVASSQAASACMGTTAGLHMAVDHTESAFFA